MARMHHNARRHNGFTVTELIVVVSIIALIIALIVPSIAKVRASTRTLRCLTNQRQLSQAAYAYATANAGRWASPRTNIKGTLWINGADDYGPGGTQWEPRGTPHCWVSAQDSNVVANQYEKVSALEQGVLWPYTGTVATYVSPDEPTNPYALQNPGANTRVRSYSFNACLGVTRPDEFPNYDAPFTNPAVGVNVPLSIYNTTTIATVKQPSRMLSTLVEDDNLSYNTHGWIINPQIVGNPDRARGYWVDLPAPWRPDAITLTYVDGSTATREMANPLITDVSLLTPGPYPPGFIVLGPGPHWALPPLAPESGDSDWKWFRDRLNPGVLPGIVGQAAYSE